jgi:hypothetical protein
MMQTIDSLRVSDYGEIEFFMQVGHNTKFPVTIYTARKEVDQEKITRKQARICELIEELVKE